MIPRLLPASVHAKYNDMSCTPLSEKSRAVFNTHILHHGTLGWAVEREDYAELRLHVITKCCMPVNHTTMQCTTKLQNHRTIPGIRRTRGVM